MAHELPLYSSEAVRSIDCAAIGLCGIEAWELMDRAGTRAFDVLRRHWPDVQSLLVLCGPGNNGGDGYVVARLAREAGMSVRVLVAREREGSSPEARRARAGYEQAGGAVQVHEGMPLPQADLIVDALFGVGLSTPPREPEAALIVAAGCHGAPVFALDVPSGLDADRGCAPGAHLAADRTISFIAAKRGLYTGAAPALAGVVEVAALGVPEAAFEGSAASARLWRPGMLGELLQRRRRDAHKGQFGHVLVVGGDHGMGGAVRIAAEAALRSGAGLVSAATRAGHVAPLLSARPECMAHAVESAADLAVALDRADVVAVGPGLGRGQWGRQLWDRVLACECPRVIDADALNLLAQAPQAVHGAVLTPHPGEAARLLGVDTGQVQADRFEAAAALAGRFDAVVVLKGAGTVVAAQGLVPVVIGAGNPGMAGGGMGDALTGIVAALLAQGLAAFPAAACGALLHAHAGDLAAVGGQRGLLAGDLIGRLRQAANPQ
ncbi:MAG TPA: NAD(P)H-hydrate dehydratase [Xanthomonadaceae bacterium]|nr:NAD(P)H-hydrate dehydratase [Xanthomonadaceae bacterium]